MKRIMKWAAVGVLALPVSPIVITLSGGTLAGLPVLPLLVGSGVLLLLSVGWLYIKGGKGKP